MSIEELQKRIGLINIRGANLGDVEASIGGLVRVLSDDMLTEDNAKLIERLQDFYLRLLEKDIAITAHLDVDKNGNIELKEDQMFHSATATSLDGIKPFATLGVVASEWFGELESEKEGRFCVFLNRVMQEPKEGSQPRELTSYRSNVVSRTPTAEKIVFYFDSKNPLMKKLAQLDYFEYEQIKSVSPEKIEELYSKEYISLIENVIEPLSKAGRNMHKIPNGRTSKWMAIPGGVPPQFINGIAIHSSNKELMKNLDEISELFPYATIFDENRKCLKQPKVLQSKKAFR